MEDQAAGNGGGPDRPARNVGSRKRARGFPKGRQLDAEALREVRKVLGARPRRADLLIEFLHLLQDHFGYLSARHLRALCTEMRLPQAAARDNPDGDRSNPLPPVRRTGQGEKRRWARLSWLALNVPI